MEKEMNKKCCIKNSHDIIIDIYLLISISSAVIPLVNSRRGVYNAPQPENKKERKTNIFIYK